MKYPVMHIYTDGGARGNPGPSAIGIVLCDAKDIVVVEHREFIGETTNNVAEYTALIRALEIAKEYTMGDLICTSDSELLVKQMHGAYAVKAEHLIPLYAKVQDLIGYFQDVKFVHVRREHPFIVSADRMVNEVLDAMAK